MRRRHFLCRFRDIGNSLLGRPPLCLSNRMRLNRSWTDYSRVRPVSAWMSLSADTSTSIRVSGGPYRPRSARQLCQRARCTSEILRRPSGVFGPELRPPWFGQHPWREPYADTPSYVSFALHIWHAHTLARAERGGDPSCGSLTNSGNSSSNLCRIFSRTP